MEKLRLLVTTKCPNKCPMCCNNSWDFSKLPVVEHFNISTFPQDYHFLNQSPHYICGMSVPPVMMAQVASRIWKYWLSKL